jgi:transcriptional regulator with XRE-family HTH domain
LSEPITTRDLFPRRLKEARLAAGLTQEKLGTLAGLSIDVARMRINRYERGTSEAPEATARALAKALGVPLAALYADSPVMAQVIEAVARLPQREQKKLADELAARVLGKGKKVDRT